MTKFLLTSGGIINNSIRSALEEMMGKPIAEATALFVPTAEHPLGPFFVGGSAPNLLKPEWKAFGVLELTALPSIPQSAWLPKLQTADALLVGGGDPLYLNYWLQQSGLAERLPDLGATVYVGMSAGSMVLSPNIGEYFVGWRPPTNGDDDKDDKKLGDKTLGLVDFAMFPHLDHEMLPHNTMVNAEKWAATMSVPSYVVDDETAFKVVGETFEVISEGKWKLLTSGA